MKVFSKKSSVTSVRYSIEILLQEAEPVIVGKKYQILR